MVDYPSELWVLIIVCEDCLELGGGLLEVARVEQSDPMLQGRVGCEGMVGLGVHHRLKARCSCRVFAFKGFDPAKVVIHPWTLFSSGLAEEFVLGGVQLTKLFKSLACQSQIVDFVGKSALFCEGQR